MKRIKKSEIKLILPVASVVTNVDLNQNVYIAIGERHQYATVFTEYLDFKLSLN